MPPVTQKVFKLPASTATVASLRSPHGTAPTSPVNGDIWTTTAGVFARVNGVTKQLDSAAPYCGASVILGAPQSIPTATNTAVAYSTEAWDTDGFWVIGSPTRFTIPAGKAGKYMVTHVVEFAHAAGGIRSSRIYVNGVNSANSSEFDPSAGGFSLVRAHVAVLNLAVADYVEFIAFQNSGGAVNVNATNTKASISYLGA